MMLIEIDYKKWWCLIVCLHWPVILNQYLHHMTIMVSAFIYIIYWTEALNIVRLHCSCCWPHNIIVGARDIMYIMYRSNHESQLLFNNAYTCTCTHPVYNLHHPCHRQVRKSTLELSGSTVLESLQPQLSCTYLHTKVTQPQKWHNL